MKKKRFHITQENICSVNNHLKKQFTINRRRDRVAPFARFISILLYIASSCLLFYGIGCKIYPPMSTVTVLNNIWNIYYSYLPIFDMAWYFSLLAMVLTVYVPIFVAPIVIYLLACLLYHPKAKFETPSGSGYEQAQILVENQKKADDYPSVPSWLPSVPYAIEDNLPIICSVVSAVIPALCSVIIAGITSNDKAEAIIGGTLVFALIGLALWFVSLPYWVWIIEVYFSHVNNKYRYAIDEYWLANDDEEVARREEAKKRAETDRRQREDDYISSMAKIYAQEKKEKEEYLKRLHEWATDGDDPTPGCGDGI